MQTPTRCRKRRSRANASPAEDDPLAGMANLFDAGMVFAVALILALVTYLNLPEMLSNEDVTIVKNPGEPNMQIIHKQGVKLDTYQMTTQDIGGEGEKLGICYKLKSGEVVYIPEDAVPVKQAESQDKVSPGKTGVLKTINRR